MNSRTPYILIATGVVALVMSIAMLMYALNGLVMAWLTNNIPLVIATSAGFCIFFFISTLAEVLKDRITRQEAEHRIWHEGLESHRPPSRVWGDPFNRLNHLVNSSRLTHQLAEDWRDGVSRRAPPYIYLLSLFITWGAVFGIFALALRALGSPLWWLIAPFLAIAISFAYTRYIRNLAENQRQKFNDQLPEVLDALANSIKAGYSLEQGIEFVHTELNEPARSAFGYIAQRVQLDHPISEALKELRQQYPSNDFQLVSDGIILQRQVGGNLPAMLQEMAELIRNRVKLAKDIRNLSAQGRLSAWVLAALVPVSLVIFLFFPGYADALYSTFWGSVALVVAICLILAGILIINRLLRLEL